MSIKNFFAINIPLLLLSFIQYNLIYNSLSSIIFTIFFLRNIFLTIVLYFSIYNKEYIVKPERINQNHGYLELFITLCSTTLLQVLTHKIIIDNYNFKCSSINDIVFFIPISFLYEIIFDFFHYWAHRLEHKRFLYKYIHRLHHNYNYPLVQFTFHHHPLDYIFTNSIPDFITLLLMPKISFFTYNAIIIYKIFIEISGHSGKKIRASSFPQCIWLPRFFNIHLTTECHDNHHIYNNCNYSKRFSIWDKVFGTFKK